MGSFKLKLVLWFALLALLPLVVAFYGYDSLAKRSETRRVDAGLQSSLRAAVAGYQGRLDAASAQAAQLAAEPRLQRALRGHDVATLRRVVARVPGASVTGRGLHVGVDRRRRPASLRDGDRRWAACSARVSVRVPVDDAPARAARHVALAPGSELVATRGGRVIAGRGRGQRARGALGPARRGCSVGGSVSFRALATAPLTEPKGLAFVALSPQSAIDAAARKSPSGGILLVLAGSLALIAIVTYLLGRSIVGRSAASPTRPTRSRAAISSERVEVRGRDEFAAPRQRLQRHGGAAPAAARRARDRADPRPGRGRPVRRGARRDPRLDAAPAGDRRDGGRGDRRRRRPRARPRGRARADRRSRGARRAHRLPAPRRRIRLRVARDHGPTLRRRPGRGGRVARGPGRRRARERAAAPDRRAAGARRQPDRAREPAQRSRRRCAPSSRALRASATRSASCSPTSTTSSASTTATATPSGTRC